MIIIVMPYFLEMMLTYKEKKEEEDFPAFKIASMH